MEKLISGLGCFVVLGVLLFNVTIGAWSTSYLLWIWLGKDIPLFGDIVIGAIAGELTVPAAIVTWLLRLFGAV